MKHTLLAMAAAAALLAAGCSSPSSSPRTSGPAGTPGFLGVLGPTRAPGAAAAPVTVRLGLVTDPSQAPALAGARQGFFAHALAPRAHLKLVPFRTSAAEAAALEAGKLDAAYASPDTILSVCRTSGASFLRIISGAASGGAELVVKPGISTPAQLKGQPLAVPSAGGAQDIALRYWLQRQHLATAPPGRAVTITPIASGATAVHDFTTGRIAGAWEPAPYDVEMTSAGGHVLASEADLWPGGQFATTNLIVTQAFLAHHTPLVLNLLKGQIQANDYLHHNLPQASLAVSTELTTLTGTHLPPPVLAASLAQITFTNDPIAASLATQAQHATAAGLPQPTADLTSLYDLTPLNLLLRAAGEPPATP